jgi:alcohol dehydrogenase class IV
MAGRGRYHDGRATHKREICESLSRGQGMATTQFEFATATRILFGPGKLKEIGSIAANLGKRVLVVQGRNLARSLSLRSILGEAGIEFSTFEIRGEPTNEDIIQGVRKARESDFDLIIGFGGGSVIDSAKAIAAVAANPGELSDYQETIGGGKPILVPALASIAIPTTAGTGAEVTRNAVLASPQHRVKASLRSAHLLPRVALVDPELTYGLPPSLTASTGLDALTQLIEPFVSVRSNPLTDALCLEGIRRAAGSLQRAYDEGNDPNARRDMALASLLGGLALANSGLGAVHGFAAPIGGMFSAPHGAVCAALLPHVMEINIRALRLRGSNSDSLNRYAKIANIVTESEKADVEEGIAWVRDLCHRLKIPGLRAYGIQEKDVAAIVEQAVKASSMKANPIALTNEELTESLTRAM